MQVDKLYEWKTCHNSSIVKAMKQQSKDVQNEFDRRLTEIIAQFKEQGWNSNVYYKIEKKKMEKTISVAPIVPTSQDYISSYATLAPLLRHRKKHCNSEKCLMEGHENNLPGNVKRNPVNGGSGFLNLKVTDSSGHILN
ncbi:hypothetical protein AgCh_017314 [Apium graveolens]